MAGRCAERTDGIHTVSYTATLAGEYSLSVRCYAGGAMEQTQNKLRPIAGSPFHVMVEAARVDPSQSALQPQMSPTLSLSLLETSRRRQRGHGVRSAAAAPNPQSDCTSGHAFKFLAGEEIHLGLRFADAFGNLVSPAEEQWQVRTRRLGDGQLEPAAQIMKISPAISPPRGQHETSYRYIHRGEDGGLLTGKATLAGVYELSVLISGVPIRNSPLLLSVSPASASATKSYVARPPPSVAEAPQSLSTWMSVSAGSEIRLLVVTADDYGNPLLSSSGNIVRVRLNGPARPKVHVIDCEDGSYTASFVPIFSGVYDCAVQVRGAHVQGSPIKLAVSPDLSSPRLQDEGDDGHQH